LGTIAGKVHGEAGAIWILELHPETDHLEVGTTMAVSSYEFHGWPEGKYRIRLMQDINRDEMHNTGSVIPFAFSEPFRWYPDTLTIRPRWTNETDITWTSETQP